ncbi:acyl-CoA dehydrogenase family protein [Micromonospora okii]|uniref:acyl-CoA dehydrogenase family protein n=1 Tax=Micromonospora okii TaxID=1182970 RepID=UPI001E594CD1|nr:acyl-CoA dehydrogenase family protein [Micromonospora okii]
MSIDEYLAEPSTARELDRVELTGAYPTNLVAALHERGLADLLAPANASTRQLCELHAVTARRSGSLAITVGVTGLALLPVYLSGTAAQQAGVTTALLAGASAALLLSEWEHGSNLLRNTARAHAEAGGYRLTGTKQLINGGSEHDLLVALLRTGEPGVVDGLNALSLFLVPRDRTVEALPRWRTGPTRGADISGVRFADTYVPADALLGRAGTGFSQVQKTLMMSHAGIAALASGSLSGATEVAIAYARQRDVYGQPIVTLGAIAEHLVRMTVLDTVVAATAVKAACAVNVHGPGGGYLATVAKYLCPRLAEEAITEGRRVLGARALLDEHPYARYVRDVPLYSVFDGTSHVMLEDLSARLPRLRPATTGDTTLAGTGECYSAGPRRIVDIARRGWRPYSPPLTQRCADLSQASGCARVAALDRMAHVLRAIVGAARARGIWAVDQALRFSAASSLAEIEALLATCELVCPACRDTVGVTGVSSVTDRAALDYATWWLGNRVVRRLQDLIEEADAPGTLVAELPRPAPAREAREVLRAAVLGRHAGEA